MRAHYEIVVKGRREHYCGTIETAVAYVDEYFSRDQILDGTVRIKAVDQFNIIMAEYKEGQLDQMVFDKMVSDVNRKGSHK